MRVDAEMRTPTGADTGSSGDARRCKEVLVVEMHGGTGRVVEMHGVDGGSGDAWGC